MNDVDLSADSRWVDGAPLPWTPALSTTASLVSPNVSARSDSNCLDYHITMDVEVKDESLAHGVLALTSRLVTSA